jgi:hypothetical protein
MTVGVAGDQPGTVLRVENEIGGEEETTLTLHVAGTGIVAEDLRVGASPARAVRLEANSGVSFWGVKFYGDGFIVTAEEAAELAAAQCGQSLARPFVSGRDLTSTPRHLLALDCDGLVERDLSTRFPATYQHLLDRVKPVREHNPRAFKRGRWWIFGENQPGMRASVRGFSRCVMTTETAKHRVFHLMPSAMLAEGTVAVIALDDGFFFGVLSSRIHIVWSLATGGTLEDRPRYNKTLCFETFPFPTATEAQQTRIRDLAERLDAHRKRQQAQHPKLTLTDCYNVLEKLRAGAPLDARELLTHEHGLVTVLRQLHDDLDAAVAEVYALPLTAPDDAILAHLCALNVKRAAEERTGHIRWLRPSFQNPTSTATQTTLATGEAETVTAKARPAAKLAWPKTLAAQAQAVRGALLTVAAPADAATLAKTFKGAKTDRIEDILETLASLGQARTLPDGRFVAA